LLHRLSATGCIFSVDMSAIIGHSLKKRHQQQMRKCFGVKCSDKIRTMISLFVHVEADCNQDLPSPSPLIEKSKS
jgi:hypothetical protein